MKEREGGRKRAMRKSGMKKRVDDRLRGRDRGDKGGRAVSLSGAYSGSPEFDRE